MDSSWFFNSDYSLLQMFLFHLSLISTFLVPFLLVKIVIPLCVSDVLSRLNYFVPRCGLARVARVSECTG